MGMGGRHGSQQVLVGSRVAYSVAFSFSNEGGGGRGVRADGKMSFACVPVYHGELGKINHQHGGCAVSRFSSTVLHHYLNNAKDTCGTPSEGLYKFSTVDQV